MTTRTDAPSATGAFARLAARFARDEQGLETVEFAIMTGLMTAATVAAAMQLNNAVSVRLNGLAQTLNDIG